MIQRFFLNRVNMHRARPCINQGEKLAINVLPDPAKPNIARLNRAKPRAKLAPNKLILELGIIQGFLHIRRG